MKTKIAALAVKFLTLSRIKSLQESIGFLDNYLGAPKDELHEVRNKDESAQDLRATQLLRELGVINARRAEIIKELTK